MRPWLALLAIASACSVEKLPPIRMVHGDGALPKRVVLLPTECVASDLVSSLEDPKAWCKGIDVLIASELAFRGIEVVDLAKLPARDRERIVVEVTAEVNGEGSASRRVTITGPTYSDVDMWTQRRALAELGIAGLVRARTTRIQTWPVRSLALVRVTRVEDAALLRGAVCEIEVSRADGDSETIERAVRCAVEDLAR